VPAAGPRPAPGFDDPADVGRAREVLTAAGYSDDSLLKLVGAEAHSSPPEGAAALALARVEKGSTLETLILLFLVGAPVTAARARGALAPMTVKTWTEAGLIAETGREVSARVRLAPFRGLWMAYDPPEHRQRSDYVMGIGSTTLRLADVAIRRPLRSMLDLCAGCGTQALLAARHCRRVVATDDSPRAVAFTRFNLAINGVENVDVARGDLFEPVAKERFELVLANPPFVISPDRRLAYRDGGADGDGFCRRLVREVPGVLEEGGYCQMLCNWAHHRGSDWKERLAGWFKDSGCDAWVMRVQTEEPAAYASKWINQTEAVEPRLFTERFRAWTDYYREQEIEAISSGVITMRRSSDGPNWLRVDENPPRLLGPCGDDIEMMFALRDFLETSRDDARLLEIKPHASPVLRMHQHLFPSGGGWEMRTIELRREQGLGSGATIDPYVAGLVGRCDGERTLRDLIDELARALGRDPAEVTEPMLGVVRQLIENGFLLPEGVFG